MSFGRPASSGVGSSIGPSQNVVGAVQYCPRPNSATPASRDSRRSGSSRGSDNTRWEMSLDEFKRQVQNQFTVVLSWDEVRALQKLYGEPDSGTIDFMKFAVALGKSPGHGPDNTRRAYNFLPKHTTEYDLNSIEKKIIHKLEDRCEVAGNYQYQWARRLLCDSTSTLAGGMGKEQLKLRLSGLLGVELSNGEMDVLFDKYAEPATGRVQMQSFATRLLAPDRRSGWFLLDNQMREPVVTNRISPSARYHNRPGVGKYKPLDTVFPKCLKGFKWDIEKLVTKLKLKMHEHAQGIAGYQFLAGCNLFRHEVPNRKGDRMSADEFRRAVEYKFGMKLDPDEVLALFHFLVPGTGDTIEIAEMVRVLVPSDYTDSWFSTRESTDMFGFTKAAPDKVVLQAKKMSVGGSWNLSLIENKIREKIHERVGGTGVFEVQAAYTLFLDGRNTGLTKKGFKAQMHDKFAVVLSEKDVDDVFAKYDPKGTGSLDVHKFVLRIISPSAQPEPWFRDRATYEFHVLNRAPMKKDPMKAECWKRTRWTFRQFETTLRDKLLAKSSQDGGRFAYKSAVNLLRSANPDHLDSSNLDREALKFVIFRRFDIVMDDHLLDEVFARFDPEDTGKMPVNRLVQHLLPASHDGSHHLVPKTDDQGQATRTLLGKIFGMTGKRREIINLNGSGVEDPQAQSLLERMAVGDKGDGEKIKANLAHKAKVAAVSAAAVQIAAAEAARNGPKVTPASLAAAAERRRNNSPLEFSGDVVPSTKAAQAAARPETSSTNSSRSSAAGLGSGCHDGGGGHRTPRQTPASAGAEVGTVNQVRDNMKQGSGQSLDMLQEKEQRLDALEKVLRKREEAVNSFVQTIPAATAGGVKKANDVRARGVATTASVGATNAQPPRTQRVQPASATALRRQRAGGQHLHVRRPASSSTAGGEHGQGRPQSARSGRSLKSRTEEEEKLIARCQALSAARRKAANQRRMSPTQAPNRPETQPDPPKVDHHNPDNTDSVRKPPTVPATPPSSEDPRTQIEAGLEREMIGETHRTNAASPSPADDHYKATETRAGETVVARVPSRPRSAVAICRREVSPRPRPRSAATSRSVGADSDKARGESLVGSGGGGNSISTVEPETAQKDSKKYLSKGPAHGTRRPSSTDAAVRDRGKRYRKRLDSAYAMQMKAMQRLQKRSGKQPSPERPVSGGCQGVGAGQFRSRYSGIDRFVLLRGMEGARERLVETGASRFGVGVPFYGCY